MPKFNKISENSIKTNIHILLYITKDQSFYFLTFFKATLSGEMMEVLVGREVDLDEGNETAAVTAVAMVVILKKKR